MKNTLYLDLLATKELIYKPLNFDCSILQAEVDNAEKGAYQFTLEERRIKFRVAKITPIKIGQFVILRVGPTSSRQAQNTQHWQPGYFLEVLHNQSLDRVRAQRLYQQK